MSIDFTLSIFVFSTGFCCIQSLTVWFYFVELFEIENCVWTAWWKKGLFHVFKFLRKKLTFFAAVKMPGFVWNFVSGNILDVSQNNVRTQDVASYPILQTKTYFDETVGYALLSPGPSYDKLSFNLMLCIFFSYSNVVYSGLAFQLSWFKPW